jgi:hypothetical protein
MGKASRRKQLLSESSLKPYDSRAKGRKRLLPKDEQIFRWLDDSELLDWIDYHWKGEMTKARIKWLLNILTLNIFNDKNHDWTFGYKDCPSLVVGANLLDWTLWIPSINGPVISHPDWRKTPFDFKALGNTNNKEHFSPKVATHDEGVLTFEEWVEEHGLDSIIFSAEALSQENIYARRA